MSNYKRPYIILSAAMTIDGKIASQRGDPELSDEQDWKEVHKLRSNVDAIIVGKNTILKDNPKLHIKFHNHKGYYRIVVDSNLKIPLDSKVICFQPEIYPTIICTTEYVPIEKIKAYEAKNIKIIRSGTGKKVNLVELMSKLYEYGIHSLLLEGGGTLNWSFIKNHLIDEIRLTIAPWIVGGKNAVSLVDGEGFKKMIQSPRFNLINIKNRDNYVILHYKRRD
jgi:2,5-diamino-6-(ribosylamino)-4(3H)-pyrimidinone 5'-phosphate reductase